MSIMLNCAKEYLLLILGIVLFILLSLLLIPILIFFLLKFIVLAIITGNYKYIDEGVD